MRFCPRRPRPLVASLSRFKSAAAICAALAVAGAGAATVVWDAGSTTDTNWSTGTNWAGDAEPTAADDALFPAPIPNPGALVGRETITLSAGEVAKSLTFRAGYTFTGGDLTLNAGLTPGLVTVAPTITATINSSLTALDFTLAANNGLAGGDAQAGGGTLVLGAANTLTGTTTLNAGTLRLANASALGTSTAAVNSGATLEVANVTITNNLTLNDGATLLGTGGAARSNGVMTVTSGATVGINSGAAGDVFTLGDAANDLTGGGAGTAIHVGGSGRVVLNNANNITASYFINSGALQLNDGAALGNTANVATVNAGGRLTTSFAANGVLGNSVELNGGTFSHATSNQVSFAAGRMITLNAASTLDVSLVLPGKILLGTGQLLGTGNLMKTGPGALQITGANAGFTGETILNNGVAEIGTGGLGSNTITINAGELVAAGAGTILSNNLVINGGALSGDNGEATFAGMIDAAGDFNVRLKDFYRVFARNLTISGPLSGGGDMNVLAPDGAAELRLTGDNTAYDGNIVINANAIVSARTSTALGLAAIGEDTRVVAGGQLRLMNGITTSDVIILSGAGVANTGALNNFGGVNTITGTPSLVGDATVHSAAGNLILGNTTMSITSPGTNLTVQGAGEITLKSPFNLNGGALIKGGTGALVFDHSVAAIPAMTWNSGVLAFNGPQSFGAAIIGTTGPATATAWRFDSDPGAGVPTITVPAGTTLITHFSAPQSFFNKLGPGSNGTLALARDISGVDLSTTNFVGSLAAIGVVRFTGTLPGTLAYMFVAAAAGSAVAPNELILTAPMSGAHPVTVAGTTLDLTNLNNPATNTFTGAITANTGAKIRKVNNTNFGAPANGVTLSGGTLQLAGTSGSAGQIFGQLGNNLNGGPRVITVGPPGGTIEVPASTSGATGWVLMGNNNVDPAGADPLISGGGTPVLTKTGLGFLFLVNGTNFPGKIEIAPNGNQFDIRGNGRLLAANEVVVNTGGFFNVDNQNGLGASRQVAGAAVADRVVDTIPVTLQGGRLLFTGRNQTFAVVGNAETFGTVNLKTGQSEVQSARSGGGGTDLIVGNLARSAGGTVRFTAGNTMAAAGDNGRILISNIGGSPTADNQFLGGWAVVNSADFGVYKTQAAAGAAGGVVAYGATVTGLTIPGYVALSTTTVPGGGGFASGNVGNAAADVTLGTPGAAQTFVVGALRLSGAATRQILFGNTTNADTLLVESGGILSDGNNNTRTFGATTSAQTRGRITAGPASATTPQELFLHVNSGTTTIHSQIIDNPNNAAATVNVVKDLDGTVALSAGTNTYSGGTLVLRGTLTAQATGSLGSGLVTVKNATLNIDQKGASTGATGVLANEAVYRTVDNAQIVLTRNVTDTTGAYNAAGDRFSISNGSVLYANSPGVDTGFNSLTRIATSTSFTAGGQVFLEPGAIVRHNLTNAPDQATGFLTIKNLGTDADLFFSPGSAGGTLQTVTLGLGTPWRGISGDRSTGAAWTVGNIIANSDFHIQSLLRDNGYGTLTFGATSAGSYGIVNAAGKPISAFVSGLVVFAEDSPVSMPSDLTFVIQPGAIVQTNASNSFGSAAGNFNAPVVVQAGGTLDPGNISLSGVPSSFNTNVSVEAGGRLILNDGSGAGANTGGATSRIRADGVLELGNARAFLGNNTGLVNAGQFVYEPGAIVRMGIDSPYKLSQFVTAEPSGERVVYEIFNGSRSLANQVDPFLTAAVGTVLVAPENIRISNGGMITQDASDREVTTGRGRLALGNGAVLAGTTQAYLNMRQSFDIDAGATVTIGSTRWIDGLPKLGGVQLVGGRTNTAGAGATVDVIGGAQLAFGGNHVFPDGAALNLAAAVTQFPTPGATTIQPANGSTLLLNYTGNFTEIIGALTGNGAVILNNTNTGNPALTSTALAAGFNAPDFTFNGVFKSYNTQNPGLTKVGPNRMTLTGVSDSTGDLRVTQGQVAIGGAGVVAFANSRVDEGARLILDNSFAPLNNRLGGKNVSGQGGVLELIGHATTPVTETVNQLNNGGSPAGGRSSLNITPGAATTTFVATTIENFLGSGGRQTTWVFRSPTLGNLPGSYDFASVYTLPPGYLTNGLVQSTNPNFTSNATSASQTQRIVGAFGTPVVGLRPDLLGDTDPNGLGDGFVTQDTGGGFRLLANSEYSPTFFDNANTNLNVRLSGTRTTSGDTRFQTLTLTPGATLNISGDLPLNETPSRLHLNAGGLFVQSGGAASTINGGAGNYLQAVGGSSLYAHVQGDLNINAIILSDTGLVKTGFGTLNLGDGAATQIRNQLVMNNGALNFGANNSLYYNRGQANFTGISVQLNGGTLNLNGNSQIINGLNSSSFLTEGLAAGGTLTSATPASVTVQGGGTFSGQITGAISLDKVGNNTLTLTNANTTTGNVKIRGGTLSLQDQGTLSNITGTLPINYGTLILENGNLARIDNRLPTSTQVDMRGGQIILLGRPNETALQTFARVDALEAQNTLRVDAGGGGASQLTINNLNRTAASRAVVNFTTSYGFLGTGGTTTSASRVMLGMLNGGAITLSSNIIGGWAIANGDHFATNNGTTGISTLSNTNDGYANYDAFDLSAASASTGALNYNDGSNRTIVAGAAVNAIRHAPGAAQTLTLSGALTINSGGLLTNANQTITYTGGSITSGTDSLYLWVNQGTTVINSIVTGGIDFVRSGGATVTLGGANTFTGTTYINGGTTNLNVAAANADTVVAVPGNLVINNATVTESLPQNIKGTATVTLNGGDSILNLRDAGSVNETLAALVFNGNGGSTNVNRPIVGRGSAQATSSLSLTAATPITSHNDNPSTVPTISTNIGTLNFTGPAASPQTINITSAANVPVGFVLNANIGTIPTGVATGGLVKTGTGLLALGGSATTFGSPVSLTNVLDVQQGILRVDNAGALGSNFANTVIRSGAGLLYRNLTANGSVTLNANTFIGPTEGNAGIGTATTTAASATLLNIAGSTTAFLTDFFIQKTSAANITVNGRLTGSGNIALMGTEITQGAGGGGIFQLANPITDDPAAGGITAGANDYSGTITVNENTLLLAQPALIAPATSVTGNGLGTAAIALNGGRLRLRDDFATDNVTKTNQTANYGNNVTLLGDSFLDANRTTGSHSSNTINLGALSVPSGPTALTVDSTNTYRVGFATLGGAGTLVKGGNAVLSIDGYAGDFSGNIAVAGPQGIGVQPAFNLVLNAATNTLTNLTVDGSFVPAASRTLTINGTLAIGSNAGQVNNGTNGVTTGNVTGAVQIPSTATVTFGPAAILRNDGVLGVTGGAVTLSPATIQGSGLYQTVGQALTLNGQVVNGPATTRLRIAGDSSVTLTNPNNTHTGGAEVQSGTLRIVPTAASTNPLGTGATRVIGSPATTLAIDNVPAAAVSGTLEFSGTSITQAGNITNNGSVRVSSGTTTVSGTIAGTPLEFVPGLLEGRLSGTSTAAGQPSDFGATRPVNPGNFGIKLEPRMGQVNLVTGNPLTGWSDNDVWIYTGQFYDADGIFTFAENIDDGTLLAIDGITRINNGSSNTLTSSASSLGQSGNTIRPAGDPLANSGTPLLDFGNPDNDANPLTGNAGWHTFELRMRNGTGGAGPNTGNGSFVNFGFGLAVNGSTALDLGAFTRPIDPGNATLFRTPVGGKGNVRVDASATLNAGGVNQTATITLNGGAGPGTSAKLNLTTASASAADTLDVTGGAGGEVDVAAGGSLTVQTLSVSASGRVALNPNSNGTVTFATAHVLNPSSVVEIEGGLIAFNGTGGDATAVLNVNDGTASVNGSLTASVNVNGGTLGGTGTIVGLVTANDGVIAPGNSAGRLDTGSFDLQAPARLVIEIGGPAAGTQYDQLNVTGGVTLAGDLQGSLINGFVPAINDRFFIILNDGTDPVAGTFAGLDDGDTVLFGAFPFTVSYDENGDAGAVANDVALIAQIPEPGALLSLLGGLGMLAGLGRFRQRASRSPSV